MGRTLIGCKGVFVLEENFPPKINTEAIFFVLKCGNQFKAPMWAARAELLHRGWNYSSRRTNYFTGKDGEMEITSILTVLSRLQPCWVAAVLPVRPCSPRCPLLVHARGGQQAHSTSCRALQWHCHKAGGNEGGYSGGDAVVEKEWTETVLSGSKFCLVILFVLLIPWFGYFP